MKSIRLLALDPGTTNFGWAIVRLDGKKPSVEKCGMLPITVKELRGNLKEEVLLFAKPFTKLLKEVKVDGIVCERYIARRMGKTIESVNIMIGAIAILSGVLGVNIYPAMTWKNFLKRSWQLEKIDDYYSEFENVNRKSGIPDHCIDASLIGIYELTKTYSLNISSVAIRKRLAKEIQKNYIGVYGK
jgi:hypothetical protein